eukprot:scpid11480/ scgid5446/ Uncharacterized WD repeat-containing protein alr2800
MAFSLDVNVEEKARLTGHRWQLSDLEFNVDGTMLASASWDKEVRVWDLFTLDTVCTLKDQHAVPITTLSWFPPDGSLIATGSADCTACLWSVESAEMLVCLKEHFGWVMDSSFSANGSALATASWDKTIRVWDPATGSLLTTLNGHTKGVYSCHFHPAATSNVVCSASEDETVRIWDTRMQGNKPMRTLIGGHDDAVCCCRWSPDGKTIASGGADHRVTVWDSREGKVISQLREHSDAIKALAFHPSTGPWEGKTMLASAGDTACCFWDPAEMAERDLLFRHAVHGTKDVEALAFTPDGTVMATGGRDNEVVLSFLSLPGDTSGDGQLAWVKRQTEERARLQAIEDEERRTEELERQREHSLPYAEGAEDSGEESSDEDEEDDEEDEYESGDERRNRRWGGGAGELPEEAQRRQLRKPPVSRRSSAMVLSNLRRHSIYGDSGGMTSPRVLRSTLSVGLGTDKDSAYAMRQNRLLRRAVEIRSSVKYLGDAVTEHGNENCSEDEDTLDAHDQAVSGDENEFADDAARSALYSRTGSTVRFEAVAILADETDGDSYEKTKTMTLGKLPDETPRLAISMPASRSNSIHNFFSEPDPLPDRPQSGVLNEAEVLQELDLALADEEDDEDEDDIDQVYGEPVLQYVAEPIRPPVEYLERQKLVFASESYATAPQPPSAAADLGVPNDGKPPPTHRRPTYTLTKVNPSPRTTKKPPPIKVPGVSSDSEDYEPMSDDDKEGYEDVEDEMGQPRRPGAPSSKNMTTHDSGIASNRASVNSHSSRSSEASNRQLSASADSSMLKGVLAIGAAVSGASGVDVSKGSPGPSRKPSVKSQGGGTSPGLAHRRLPQPPPPGASSSVSPPSGSVSPHALTTPPLSSATSSAPSPAPPHPANVKSRPASGEYGSPLVSKKPLVAARPTISSRAPAKIPGKPDSGSSSTSSREGGGPASKAPPFLDKLVEEEKYKSHSAPNSPATSLARNVKPAVMSKSRTPPPAARRPDHTLPFIDSQPKQLDGEQTDYMDFTLPRGVTGPGGGGGGGAAALLEEEDGDQDEYMMFDDANQTSVI